MKMYHSFGLRILQYLLGDRNPVLHTGRVFNQDDFRLWLVVNMWLKKNNTEGDEMREEQKSKKTSSWGNS